MRKFLITAIISIAFTNAKADFGVWASAAYLTVNGVGNYYNTLKFGSPAQGIGSADFTGSLGNFAINSGTLILGGAQLNTYKNNGGNVCIPSVYYTVYPSAARPASPTFTPITLPIGENSGNGDQTWRIVTQNIDLTSRPKGSYTLELYYLVPGNESTESVCSNVKYDSNNGANYTASFLLYDPLPVNFGKTEAILKNGKLTVNWTTESETNVDHFDVLASSDGNKFIKLGQIKSKALYGKSNQSLNYSFSISLNNPGESVMAIWLLGIIFFVPASANKRKKIVIALLSASIFMFLIACSKQDSKPIDSSKRIYVKILEIDVDGKTQESSIISAFSE